MKFVIVGCGRVGSTLAEQLDRAGHEVIILDLRTGAFDRLPDTFRGSAIRGDGTDEEVLRQAGAEGADIFLSLTEGDNRNVMAAQLAAETLSIPRVIAKINDPVRASAYADLGLPTLCRTNLMVAEVSEHFELNLETGPGIDIPTTPHLHPHSDHPAPAAPQAASTPPQIAEAPGVRPVANTGPARGVALRPGAVAEEAEAAREVENGRGPQPPGRSFRRWRGDRG